METIIFGVSSVELVATFTSGEFLLCSALWEGRSSAEEEERLMLVTA